jgi:hypothetical protein
MQPHVKTQAFACCGQSNCLTLYAVQFWLVALTCPVLQKTASIAKHLKLRYPILHKLIKILKKLQEIERQPCY